MFLFLSWLWQLRLQSVHIRQFKRLHKEIWILTLLFRIPSAIQRAKYCIDSILTCLLKQESCKRTSNTVIMYILPSDTCKRSSRLHLLNRQRTIKHSEAFKAIRIVSIFKIDNLTRKRRELKLLEIQIVFRWFTLHALDYEIKLSDISRHAWYYSRLVAKVIYVSSQSMPFHVWNLNRQSGKIFTDKSTCLCRCKDVEKRYAMARDTLDEKMQRLTSAQKRVPVKLTRDLAEAQHNTEDVRMPKLHS